MGEVVVVDRAKCTGCGQCVLVCDLDAIEVQYGLSLIKQEECVACGVCLDFCPVGALGWEID